MYKSYSNIVYNSQKVETIQMFKDWLMDRQKWNTHTMKYYSVIKRNQVDTCYNMDKPENIMLRERSKT